MVTPGSTNTGALFLVGMEFELNCKLQTQNWSKRSLKTVTAFRKPKALYFFDKLLGDGLASTEREKWARQRKLANYAFHGESLKNMTPAVVASVETMLEKWKSKEGKEIEVFQEFRLLTSEVISRTAFGSSYLEGLMKLSVIAGRNILKAKIPIISKFWKSADEIESERIAKMIHDSVMRIVKKREERVVNGEADNFGRDFLGLLVNAYHEADQKNRLSIQDLVDECKTFYLAGQETVNSLLAWATLLLAIHTDWQDKARAEVIEVFGNQNPDSEGMAKLKTWRDKRSRKRSPIRKTCPAYSFRGRHANHSTSP
ncbi:hypothetical protein ERO13_D13G036700v2 [Gossypium hirsutum]|nr:hypothetical protein ERO13_D13G036700v2 [Gossypium hirsutum]